MLDLGLDGQSTLDVARAYARNGWVVLPVELGEKHPAVPWREWTEKTPDDAQLSAWFTPDRNIAVLTGSSSGLVVLDVDAKGCDPEETVIRLVQERPTGLVSETGGGGYHLFYQHPGKAVKNAVRVRPGVDIRADGGLVVVPPSMHSSGKRYVWTSTRRPGRWEPLAPEAGSDQPAARTGDRRNWLVETLRGVPEGGRHDTGARLAAYFVHKGIPLDVVRELMDVWNQRNDPPMAGIELDLCIQGLEEKEQPVALGSIPISAYVDRFAEHRMEWLIEEWLPRGSVAIVASPPECYKTWLLTDVIVSLGSGTPFLGRWETRQSTVLWFQQEDNHGALVDRLMNVCRGRGIDPRSLRVHVHTDRALRIQEPGKFGELVDLISATRADIVIADPLYTVVDMQDYMTTAIPFLSKLKTVRDRLGTSFLFAHHTKKGGSGEREQMWGSQFINAWLESGWQLKRVGGSSVSVHRHHKAWRPLPDVGLRLFDGHGNYNVDIDEEI